MYCREYASPIGQLLLVSDGHALTGLQMDSPMPADAEEGTCPVLDQAEKWLDDYFAGINGEIGFPLRPQGTAFQQKVWEVVKSVPFGETCAYGDIAREIGCASSQAVGQAVGANPIAIVIPCHRIIGAKGQLTGYAWGVEKKKWLLEHEK